MRVSTMSRTTTNDSTLVKRTNTMYVLRSIVWREAESIGFFCECNPLLIEGVVPFSERGKCPVVPLLRVRYARGERSRQLFVRAGSDERNLLTAGFERKQVDFVSCWIGCKKPSYGKTGM